MAIDFWTSHVSLFFHISYVSALGFVHLGSSNWLEVLVTCSLSVVIFSMFKYDSVVPGLRCYFSPLDQEL
jgi:hypothetical protein